MRYVQTPGELGNPDLVILPGTKSTLDDLKWLRQSGLEAKILQHASRGGAVAGICGGYQMLGQTLSDPEGVEGGGTLRGMGLLPTGTVFRGEKTRTRVSGVFRGAQGVFASLNGAALEGYEIHMGETVLSQGAEPLTALATLDGGTKADGAARGNVWGSYVHGLFDRAESARALVDALLARKGLAPSAGAVDWQAYQEEQYDKLAAGVRAGLDLAHVYRILEGKE